MYPDWTGETEEEKTGFIYVARQLLKGKTPSLSFCQAFSLGNAKEKAEGSRATGSNAAVHSGVRRLISKFTGCPHLFADLARRGVDTQRERCLHTNEYFNLEGRIHEPRSQTAPSGNTVNLDVITPHGHRPGAGFAIGGPDKGMALAANAPGIAQELAGQGG